ncbi:hypothetical protein A9P82_02080 [Arachidicoccus ginsenosidimutans]|uniref:AtpZ/AtpI family protein n=1 Tax=Arachidicoccus sp. BS20 TaxID=1850526 RepID=UPI0007F12F83|nr:AtpZ/AtpI family protein [Arachidicoccus sp. BS20]ANI88203.1 hypothetical protein A9P82_02080 [Arachidicoccus sp. BS20]
MRNDNNSYLTYLSYGIQLAAGVGLALWFGSWIDKKITTKIPLCTWVLPLVVLVFMLVKIVREFSKKEK